MQMREKHQYQCLQASGNKFSGITNFSVPKYLLKHDTNIMFTKCPNKSAVIFIQQCYNSIKALLLVQFNRWESSDHDLYPSCSLIL